jgi:hypothetical protein
MKLLDRATDLLRRTETELRKLVSDAAKAGDYASVVQMAAWARSLSEMVADKPVPSNGSRERVARTKKLPTAAKARPTVTNHASRAGSNAYPQFFRQADRLVRVSWSKSEKKEYEHKAPLAVVKTLAGLIVKRGADGRVFTTDELMPMDDGDGLDVPIYQVYAGLSLLRQVGLIDQHGRRGYSVPRLAELKTAVEAVCQNLPEK